MTKSHGPRTAASTSLIQASDACVGIARLMQLNHEEVTSPPRASASVVLLRDAPSDPCGLEVFLLRRHTASAVLGGAYVFPGGKLDPADCAPSLHAHLDRPSHELLQALGEPDLDAPTAAGLYVAAVREALEECGVLYARARNGQQPLHDARQRQQWQQQLHAGQGFEQMVQEAALAIDTEQLAPWSRWITPRVPSITNKRFDTRFFVAVLPAQQEPVHDNVEAVDSVWLTPREALTRYWQGELVLAPPQIMTLVSLVPHRSAHSVLELAKRQAPALVEPQPFEEAGVRHIAYPGDPKHSRSERAFIGPTRLQFKNGRFEPAGGLDVLLNP
jgi:8-oxo-dGTP pyrophosphatase MutT (NUDIX family)